MTAPRLLIFDDNPDFGGHQIMAAQAIEGLLEYGDWELLGLIHPENSKNQMRWEAIRALSPEYAERFFIDTSPTQSVKFNAIRRYVHPKALRQLRERIELYAPDLILMIQGNIEQGSALFQLMPGLHCSVISYIPVPHKHAEMGAKLGALRDFTCRHFYSKPNGFLTISDTLAEMLRQHGAKTRIEVVQNGISLERFQELSTRAVACSQYSLPEATFNWAQIGRIEFKQKGQDLTLARFQERLQTHPDESLVFVGSGPDTENLLAAMHGSQKVYHIPWVDEVGTVFPAIDALILPSKYEGVPLVMLEALANQIPVAASDRDGMKDWLPNAWRFDPQKDETFHRALEHVRHADQNSKSSLQQRVFETCSLPVFKQLFNSALETWR